jgi:hypothetical protein
MTFVTEAVLGILTILIHSWLDPTFHFDTALDTDLTFQFDTANPY